MKVISTNLGNPVIIEWRGKQQKTGIYKYPVQQPVFLGSEDVENDSVMDRKHHGGADKACYLYSADHYAIWNTMYTGLEMPWEMFGENLTVEGLNEKLIYIGDTFEIGEATVQATHIRFGDPKMVKQFVKSGFSGIYVRILKKGFVKSGDRMVRIVKNNSVTVQKVFELLYADKFQKEAVEKAINEPLLADSCRKDLLKRWNEFL
jgi:MOSC domain-containing protein YiiM